MPANHLFHRYEICQQSQWRATYAADYSHHLQTGWLKRSGMRGCPDCLRMLSSNINATQFPNLITAVISKLGDSDWIRQRALCCLTALASNINATKFADQITAAALSKLNNSSQKAFLCLTALASNINEEQLKSLISAIIPTLSDPKEEIRKSAVRCFKEIIQLSPDTCNPLLNNFVNGLLGANNSLERGVALELASLLVVTDKYLPSHNEPEQNNLHEEEEMESLALNFLDNHQAVISGHDHKSQNNHSPT